MCGLRNRNLNETARESALHHLGLSICKCWHLVIPLRLVVRIVERTGMLRLRCDCASLSPRLRSALQGDRVDLRVGILRLRLFSALRGEQSSLRMTMLLSAAATLHITLRGTLFCRRPLSTGLLSRAFLRGLWSGRRDLTELSRLACLGQSLRLNQG